VFFSARVRIGHTRPSKVIDFGINRKRAWDFLLVRRSNLCPILHRFRDIAGFFVLMAAPYSTLILAVFPLDHIAHVGVNLIRYF